MAETVNPAIEGDQAFSCQPDIDYSELLSSDMFTFVVGAEKRRYHVHVSAFQKLSEPLAYMMTNGKMKESVEREASLGKVEPETFVQLAKFAYKGLCAVSDGVTGPSAMASPITGFACHICGSSTKNQITYYPFCAAQCKTIYKLGRWVYKRGDINDFNLCCVTSNCGTNFVISRAYKIRCSSCYSRFPSDPRYPPMDSTYSASTTKCGHKFSTRLYGTTTLTHNAISDHIETHYKEDVPSVPFVQHAKLYVLATMYMVKDLPEICLHKLHRCLINFEIDDEAIDEVIDLVLYTYSNTSDEGDILEGTTDKLRDLVISYVVDRASDLLKNETFRGMLGAGGAHTSDFMALAFAQK